MQKALAAKAAGEQPPCKVSIGLEGTGRLRCGKICTRRATYVGDDNEEI